MYEGGFNVIIGHYSISIQTKTEKKLKIYESKYRF